MTGGYTLSNEWHQERDRLNCVEALWDPVTIDALERTGIAPGWHCLEVGGGGGSIARWLCDRVGPRGRVLATDIAPTFLRGLQLSNLDVEVHDITCEPLPTELFDLVHARLLLEHLRERDRALASMIDAVKPGGWIVVEDTDWASLGTVQSPHVFKNVVELVAQFLALKGHDAYYGRTLKSALQNRGLLDVSVRLRVEYLEADSPGMKIFRLTVSQLKPLLVAEGVLTEGAVDEVLALLSAPDFSALSYVMVSAIARKRK